MKEGLRDAIRHVPGSSPTITPIGHSVAALGAATWLGAWWLGWTELMVLAAACVLALILSMAFTFGRTSLAAQVRLNHHRVTAGESAIGEVDIVNVQPHRSLPARLEVPIGAGLAEIDVPALGGQGHHAEPLIIATTRRCVIPVGPIVAVRGDPLGLIRREVPVSGAVDLFVHPRTVGLAGLSSGWMRDLEGQSSNDPSPSDVAFHTLREYVPGDDRRHVHWRTSARLGKLMVRQFVDTRRSHLALVLSTTTSDYADPNEFEMAVSALASIAKAAFREEQEVSCIAGDGPLAAHSAQRLLDGLSGVEMHPSGSDLRHLVQRGLPQLGGASIVAVVTGGGVGLAELRAATDLFGADVRVLGIRCSAGTTASLRHEANSSFLGLSSLEDISRSMGAVARR